MSSLRGRTRDSSWQWLVIGIILGLGLSSVVCLGGYAANLLQFNLPGQAPTEAPTAQIMIVSATPLPATATSAVTATPLPTTAVPQQAASLAANVSKPTAGPTSFVVQPTVAGSSNSVPPTAGNTPQVVSQGSTAVPVSIPTDQLTASAAAPGSDTSLPAATTDSASTFTNGATDLITIQGGSFKMGTDTNEIQRALQDCTDRDKATGCDAKFMQDSQPPHNVTINTFQMEKYEVTDTQYADFLNTLGPGKHATSCEANPCLLLNGPQKSATKGTDPGSYVGFDGTHYSVSSKFYTDRPAAYITWYGADAYCKALGRRLPTEAEWEYTARRTDGRLYPWGSTWDETKAKTSRPIDKNNVGPVPITQYKTDVSFDGVFDLAGNVSEWVSDWYDPGYYKTASASGVDPKGAPAGSEKVYRGGNWDAIPMFARNVQRGDQDPRQPNGTIGFRCALDGAGDQSGVGTTSNPSQNGTSSDSGNATPVATLASGVKN